LRLKSLQNKSTAKGAKNAKITQRVELRLLL
jgi:hypothetical protein